MEWLTATRIIRVIIITRTTMIAENWRNATCTRTITSKLTRRSKTYKVNRQWDFTAVAAYYRQSKSTSLIVDRHNTKQEIWANAHEMHESLQQFLFAGNLSPSPPISSQITLPPDFRTFEMKNSKQVTHADSSISKPFQFRVRRRYGMEDGRTKKICSTVY